MKSFDRLNGMIRKGCQCDQTLHSRKMAKNMVLIAGHSIRGIHVEWIVSAPCIRRDRRNASLVSYTLI